MIEAPPVDPQTHALANELREIATLLADCAVTPEAAAQALPLAQELRARIAAPRRERWYEVDADASDATSRMSYVDLSPLRGRLNPVAPPMQVERVEAPDGVRLRGTVRLSRAYEGPPHGVHGGIVAALFDEILGGAQHLLGRIGVTARLEVRYRDLTPIDEDLVFEGWIHEERGRRIEARATCHAGDTLTAEATGHFVVVDFGEVHERMRSRREERAG